MKLADLQPADWIKIILLAGCLVTGWFRMDSKLAAHESVLRDVSSQTTRIEHYLESNDQDYWRKVKDNGDNR